MGKSTAKGNAGVTAGTTNEGPLSLQKIQESIAKMQDGMAMVYTGYSRVFEAMAEQMNAVRALSDTASTSSVIDNTDKTAGSPSPETSTDVPVKEEIPAVEKKAEKKAEKKPDNKTEKVEKPDAAPAEAAPAETPAEAKPAAEEKPEKRSVVTKDDLAKVIFAKIRKDSTANERIGKLVTSYGVEHVSDLDDKQREKFLTDLATI